MICDLASEPRLQAARESRTPCRAREAEPVSTITQARKPALLDTDLLIDYWRRVPSAAALFGKLPDDCAISTLSVADLYAGVREGAERLALDISLGTFSPIDLNAKIAAHGRQPPRDWGKSHGEGLNGTRCTQGGEA